MALPHQLRIFCDNWRAKARAYAVDDLGGAFDRFFTSYVVFNRLYAEATYRLARRGHLNLREPFPDSRAAQDYVIQFCGAEMLTRTWEGNGETSAAIDQIQDHLINHRFALKLNPMNGDRQPDKDDALAAALRSRSRNQRAKGVLEALYAVRCNMFHGQKGFELAQLALLRPAIALLEGTVETLYRELERRDD
jgi:hypothetical protein